METLMAHGEGIEELRNQTKKMRKSQALKKSVEKLRKDISKITSAGDLPLDLLMELVTLAVQAALAVPEAPEAAAGQSEEPVATAHTAKEMIQKLINPVVPSQVMMRYN
ncbi:PREDICTED: uncharacterized protein LOC109208793 [Nicotiana attenuata]|uniref:uncharacterized protein LOC109208793 n=1 Tax=Nicotiana attenuata TaxID=49451 RepID=UPI000905CF31|nr:PREDICTED: uncharacterized protein LOC109208793 [Nicotiana attenuata]XP_019227488.1 PREDICTED: uncharacterized protein LOC109208793 [Nicotiana attenuata]